MIEAKLTGKQRRYLRGLGHHLDPVVFVGKNEVTDAVLAELREALRAHELVKVKLLESVTEKRNVVAKRFAEALGAELVQVLGRTVLLYLRNDWKAKIELPG
jgi:RNA-binding protein